MGKKWKKKFHRKKKSKARSVISTLCRIYFVKDNPVPFMTLLVWKMQQRPPKDRAAMQTAVRKIPCGSKVTRDRPSVISRKEVTSDGIRGVFNGMIIRIPVLIIENKIKYPQSLIIIKKLSMMQTSISWNRFSADDVCFFTAAVLSGKTAGRVSKPKKRGLP